MKYLLIIFFIFETQIGLAQPTILDTPSKILATATMGADARFNADGSQLLTWGQASTPTQDDPYALTFNTQVWDAVSGELLFTLSQRGASSLGGLDANWTKDETHILTYGGFSANLWDAQTGELLHEFAHDTVMYGAQLNPDETQLLTWAWRGNMAVWDANTGEMLFSLPHEPLGYNNVEWNTAQWSSTRPEIVASTWGGHYVWEANEQFLMVSQTQENIITDAAWDSEGMRVVYTTNKGEVYLWGIQFARTNQLRAADEHALDPNMSFAGYVGWNPEETRFFTNLYALSDTTIVEFDVWDAESGALLYALPHANRANCATWSDDGNRLLIASDDAHLWDLNAPDIESGHQIISSGEDEYFNCVMWNADNTQIAAWNSFRSTKIHVFDVNTNQEILVVDDPSNLIAWQGDTWVTSNFDGEVKLWTVE